MTDKMERVVAALRVVCSEYECDECPSYAWCHSNGQCLDWDAADLIESLAAELVQVKRERDAAMEDLKGRCEVCAHHKTCEGSWCAACNMFWCKSPCKDCAEGDNWRWRGVQEV